MISFDRIGGIDNPPDMRRVPEVCAEPVPVLAPAPDDYRVFLAPLDLQSIKGLFRHLLVHRLIHLLQILHELLLFLAGHILDRVADLVHDAELDRGLRENTCYRIGKALEPVHAGYEDILYPSVLEIRKHSEPEVGPLAPGNVHAQKFFPSFGIEGQHIIDGSGHRPVLLVHDLVMNRIKPHDGIHPVQRPVFPTLYLRKDTVGDAADGLGRYAVAELLLQDVAYLPRAVADGVQA